MTIKEALFATVAYVCDDLLQNIAALLTFREIGNGFQLLADESKLFISGMEEEDEYVFSNPATFLAEKTLEGGAFNFPNVGDTFDTMDILRNTLEIHKRRGSNFGLAADIKRLCNTTDVTIIHSDATGNGWILDLSAPNFELDSTTHVDTSIDLILVEFQSLINYVIIETENNSIHSDEEIIDIISREFLPIYLTRYIYII